MSSINSKTVIPAPRTAEGAVAARITPLQELIRATMSCMLWENIAYENGQSVADRIKTLVHQVSLKEAAGVAIEARNNMKLRHVPLLIVREMARHPRRDAYPTVNTGYASRIIGETLAEVIQRPDELTEFLAIYWKDGKQPLSKQVKLGLAKAFQKFDEYSLAKYNRDKDITLKDVLFLCHSKPKDVPVGALRWAKAERRFAADPAFCHEQRPDGFSEGELLYGKLIYDQLATPDTWEVELSKNGNTAEAWMRLLSENKLGDLAFLRNLRNMTDKGVSKQFIVEHAKDRKWGRVLPFRFIVAGRVVPSMEPELESWMLKCLEGADKLPGRTVLLVDVSGSMGSALSAKSDLRRLDAACGLAMLLREVCEDVTVVTFSNQVVTVPPRRGFALRDVINQSQPHGGTYLGRAVQSLGQLGSFDRLIVITDEQSADRPPAPPCELGYIINVASHQNGVGYGKWLHIDGFSEAVVDYIRAYEESLQ